MKASVVVVALLALGGCAAKYPLERSPLDAVLYGLGPQAKEFPGPDGRRGFSIACAGGARSSECYEAAAKVCDGKYDILARGNVEGDGALDVVCKA